MDPTGTRVVAAEALARWSDPFLGPISPDLFIPLAEETGLIPELGRQILRRALADTLDWPDIDIAVNVSAPQIHHGNIMEVVGEELQRSGFPAHRLEIEIAESVLLADEKRARDQVLRNLGVMVALDDFGSGYSSLQYLHKFGFDKLKIDRGFIKSIGARRQLDRPRLDCEARARFAYDYYGRGVEADEQLRVLRDLGCHQIQGYSSGFRSPPGSSRRSSQRTARSPPPADAHSHAMLSLA
jgi:EAL domain-containing protein (putative c-di-GMP-specific phosphodiesterase class I)